MRVRSRARYRTRQPQEDSLDGLDQDTQEAAEDDGAWGSPAAPVAGYGLYDAQEEADKW